MVSIQSRPVYSQTKEREWQSYWDWCRHSRALAVIAFTCLREYRHWPLSHSFPIIYSTNLSFPYQTKEWVKVGRVYTDLLSILHVPLKHIPEQIQTGWVARFVQDASCSPPETHNVDQLPNNAQNNTSSPALHITFTLAANHWCAYFAEIQEAKKKGKLHYMCQ